MTNDAIVRRTASPLAAAAVAAAAAGRLATGNLGKGKRLLEDWAGERRDC